MSDNSMYVQAYYKGGMTGFEVIANSNEYKIARNGEIIATLRHDNTWQQISGEKLSEEVIESIAMQIEKPQSQA
ncbi:MAG: hypothetical protein JWR50_3210 [Mucilaginibacter sp.]|nr:hypothetical protein [Mucilaginibacter sp.]